nr:hypothetical protein CFP56_74121 [Quercus suber]
MLQLYRCSSAPRFSHSADRQLDTVAKRTSRSRTLCPHFRRTAQIIPKPGVTSTSKASLEGHCVDHRDVCQGSRGAGLRGDHHRIKNDYNERTYHHCEQIRRRREHNDDCSP